VLVACSGGPDSLALAAATAFVAPRLGLRAGAVVVDHGLFDDSASVAGSVVDQLKRLELDPAEMIKVTVGAAGGPEAAARSARYTALDDAADRHGAQTILLGHTRDDQAETVLLGLARGSGARSLAGMAAVSGIYRRPLLGVPRSITARACADLGLTPWHDPANLDVSFTRTRVRHEVLPVLERELGPGVAEALARTADLLRADADALDAWAARAREATTTPLGLDVDALTALPTAIRTRVLRAAAIDAGCPATDLTAGHVVELDRLVTDWHGQGPLDLPGSVRGRRHDGVIRFG
jgi:tRNA(Ile)-lysidine synthase